jgi:hypothetical protein
MQNLTVNGHFIPYFRRGLACNGFDDADAMANLAPPDSDTDIVSQTINPIVKKSTSKRPKPAATTTTSETVLKNKNSLGDTVTIKTITTTVTTIRRKRDIRKN